jgi:hypothetical protein
MIAKCLIALNKLGTLQRQSGHLGKGTIKEALKDKKTP